MMRNFILADNQDITRVGMISILNEMELADEILEISSCSDLVNSLRSITRPVVIVDYSLFDFSSINHLLNIISGAKDSSWLLFGDEPEEHFLRQVLLGDPEISVVMKHHTQAQIEEALKCVSSNEVYWCDFAESVMRADVPLEKVPDQLTPSEKTILREIALGKTTKEIAAEKNLSFHTVNAHRRNIYRKLGLNSVNEVTRYALQAGLIDLLEYYI